MRYFIGSSLPPATETKLIHAYQRIYNTPPPISHPHFTIIQTFTLNHPQSLPLIKGELEGVETTNTFSFGQPGIFHQDHNTLYLPIIPTQPLVDLHTSLNQEIQPHITYDLSRYKDGILPNFYPHISLNYEYQSDPTKENSLSSAIKDITYQLSPPQLFQEISQGSWQPINTPTNLQG